MGVGRRGVSAEELVEGVVGGEVEAGGLEDGVVLLWWPLRRVGAEDDIFVGGWDLNDEMARELWGGIW